MIAKSNGETRQTEIPDQTVSLGFNERWENLVTHFEPSGNFLDRAEGVVAEVNQLEA
ncbi:hypothetical protein [Rhodopirellula sp. P2]|uniref:hypothetical protein n=1 Tax=Rhodopirellula sp. P2 TaxID=2127060 RepID=UPI002368CE9F|nr:hypothetical protein [Rhodopirellula sp. P2]WDQ17762.1 hypothetical protein PSR62_04230 [Rhodopirellula sp. P2]